MIEQYTTICFFFYIYIIMFITTPQRSTTTGTRVINCDIGPGTSNGSSRMTDKSLRKYDPNITPKCASFQLLTVFIKYVTPHLLQLNLLLFQFSYLRRYKRFDRHEKCIYNISIYQDCRLRNV